MAKRKLVLLLSLTAVALLAVGTAVYLTVLPHNPATPTDLVSPTDETNAPYTVEYYYQNLTGGYDLDEDTATLYAEALSTVTAPRRDIAGFTKEADAAESGVVSADGSLVLKVYYARNTRTMRFNTAGGSDVDSVSYLYGQTTQPPANPVRQGYTFAKWQLSGADYEFTVMPDEDVTLTAVWTSGAKTPYKVEYYYQNLNDGYGMDSDVLTLYAAALSTVTAPSRDAAGFSRETSATEKGIVKADGSTVLRVYYARNTRTMRFDAAGGSDVASVSYLYGQGTRPPADPVRQGYTFAKWQLGGADYNFPLMPDGDVNLTAVWTPNTTTRYTVEYYIRDDSTNAYEMLPSLTEVRQGTTDTEASVTPPALPSYEYSAAASVASGIISSDESLVLKLRYHPTYTLTLNTTFGGTVTGSGLYQKAATAPLTATEGLGHLFEGWYDSEGTLLSTELTYSLTTSPTDVTITAKFKQETGYGATLTDVQFVDLEANCRKCVTAAQELATAQAEAAVTTATDLTRITGEAVLTRAGVTTGTVSNICVDFENGTLLSLNYTEFGVIVVYTSGTEPTYTCVRKVWDTGVVFKVGDVMVSHGYIFRCLRAHNTSDGTSSRTRDPALRSNKSTWEVIGYTDAELPYASTVRYEYCFPVIHNGKYYMRANFNMVGGQVPYEWGDSEYWTLLPWS